METQTEAKSIALEYELPHAPEKVWRALTDPSLLGQWLMSTDMRAAVGNKFTFRMEPTKWWNGIVHCEVLALDPGKRLRYTWKGGPESSPLDTIVTWTLTPTPDGGTRLSLQHDGFVASNQYAYTGALGGWQRNVDERLRALLASI